MPSVAIVAYHFPPDGVVGAQRITKFTKYLFRSGWKIRVFTVKEYYHALKNPGFLSDVEGVEIIRTRRMPAIFPGINEEGFYWFPILLITLCRSFLRDKPDVILFTGGPYYHLVAGWLIKKLFKIPLVVDFRDPWALNPYRKKRVTSFTHLARWLEKILEPLIVKESSILINVTEEATDMYQHKYHQTSKVKFVTLPNGFDKDDLDSIKEKINFTPFDILYTGKFSSFRNPQVFFTAYKIFIEKYSLTPADTRFVWVGVPEEAVVKILQDLKLLNYCQLVGFKPYKETLRYVLGCKLCLLVAGEHPYEPTTKIFDYMALNKFILAQALSGGFISRFLKEYGKGKLVSFYDIEAILEILSRNYENNYPELEVNEAVKVKYDREELTRQLSDLMMSMKESV